MLTADRLYEFWTAREPRLVGYKILMMAVGGLFLGTITPYETSSIEGPIGRYSYWIGCVLFPAFISGPLGRSMFPLLQARQSGALAAFVAFTAVLSLPTSIWVAAWEVILKGLFVVSLGFWDYVGEMLGRLEFDPGGFLAFYARVWIITLLIVGPVSLAGDRLLPSRKQPASTPSAGHRFMRRLPAKLGTDLMCLSMEDHYVRVHTRQGDTLLLMRMSDAIQELEGYGGAQVHRSWWVATEAVEAVHKAPRKLSLTLKNGLNVPVSQRRVKQLRETGFL